MAEVKSEDLREKYPSNSINKPKPKPEPIALTSKVTMEKDRPGSKIRKLFVPGDVKDVKSYLVNNVIVPGFKNAVLGMIEIAFFGRTSGWRGGPTASGGTNYSYISTNGSVVSRGPAALNITNKDRLTNNFSNLRFTGPNAYQEVEDVISTLIDYVDRYGQATVADFYALCGVSADQITDMDGRWGWKGFRKLNSRAVRDGYIIDVEPPIQL